MMKLTEGKQMQVSETFWNEIKQIWIVTLHTRCQSKHMFCSSASVFCNYCWGEFLCLAVPEGDVNWKNLVFLTQQRTLWGKAFLWIDCVCVWNCSLLFDKEILSSSTGRLFPLFFPSGAVWLATQNHSTLVTETTVVPFLPVNPEYSSTRNQVWNLSTVKII